MSSNLFCAFFLVTPCLIVAVEPCMEWIPIKEKTKKNMVFITEGFLEVAIKSWLTGIWIHDHQILVRCSNRLSYQAMTSTSTQSQLFTATSIYIYIYILLSSTLLVFLIEMMWRLFCFCITSVRNTGGLFVGNLLEIISPLMPFENLVTFI